MMNKILLNLCFVCVLVTGLSIAVDAQEGSTRFQSGIIIAIKTERVPPQNGENPLNVYASSASFGETTHRVISDTKNKVYFGYDLKAVREPDEKLFRVSIRPLSIKPEKLLNGDGFTSQTPRKYPDDVVVADGDTITLETLENPETGAKFVDIIKVTTEQHKFGSYFADRLPPKDFTIDEVHLRIDNPDILINSEKGKTGAGVSGNVVWIYIKGRGRFIFSFVPQPGYNFKKIGIIEDNKIFFDYDGVSYRFTNKSPVLGTGGKWNLWVMFDPGHNPDVKLTEESPYQLGATDKIEYLFQKKN